MFLFDMTPINLVEALLEASYKYGTTDITVPGEFGDFLIQWGELNIPDDVLFVEEDGGAGREKEPHITVKYGLEVNDVPEALREVAATTKPFAVKLLNVSLFTTNPKFDVVKLGVQSAALHELNRRISDVVPHQDTYPTYNPHLTIAYVQKGTCDHLEGEDPFKDGVPREFMVSGMNFKAAGESGDPNRTTETLLFSRGAPDAVGELVGAESVHENKAVHRPVNMAYHAQKQDIMTRASALVEMWQRQGLTSEQMTRKLRLGEWGVGMKYWHGRREFPQAHRRFAEQATEYIENHRESQFSVPSPDPFAQCSFPVDPDRTAQFLRNSGKRRGERPIL